MSCPNYLPPFRFVSPGKRVIATLSEPGSPSKHPTAAKLAPFEADPDSSRNIPKKCFLAWDPQNQLFKPPSIGPVDFLKNCKTCPSITEFGSKKACLLREWSHSPNLRVFPQQHQPWLNPKFSRNRYKLGSWCRCSRPIFLFRTFPGILKRSLPIAAKQ